MKLTLLFFFTLVVATMGVEYESVGKIIPSSEGFANDWEICFNETTEYFKKFDEIRVDNLQTTNDDHAFVKNNPFSCLVACLGEKRGLMTGARLNLDKIKMFYQFVFKIHDPNVDPSDVDKVDEFFQQLDSCANQVKTITNKCKVAYTFLSCFKDKTQHIDH